MSKLVTEIFVLAMAAVCFIGMHEAGHFLAADILDLNPSLVLGKPTAGFLFYRMGISFQETAVPFENLFILLGALVPPVVLGAFLLISKNYYLRMFASVFLVLGILTFVPLPMPEIDANILYSLVLGMI